MNALLLILGIVAGWVAYLLYEKYSKQAAFNRLRAQSTAVAGTFQPVSAPIATSLSGE